MSEPQNPQDPYSQQGQPPSWNPPPTPPSGPQAPQWNPPPSLSKEQPGGQYPGGQYPGAQGYPGYPPPPPATGGLPYAPPAPTGYAQAVPEGYYYDPASGLTLPNATELAPVGRRIGQYFMDILLAIVTLFIGYIVWSLIVWARGQTPGMQVLHMRCYRPEHGRPAHWGYMALRQIIGGFVEGLFVGIVFLISSIMMITSNDHKAIHDHIAGTVVLYDPNDVLVPR